MMKKHLKQNKQIDICILCIICVKDFFLHIFVKFNGMKAWIIESERKKTKHEKKNRF